MDRHVQTALMVEHLTKHYPGARQPAVDNLSLTIRQGEIYGLLGPNGAGKTTTLSILSTILPPDNGSVSICGIDSRRHPMAAKRKIGLIPQDIALYPELTARENLSFFARLHGIRGERLKDRIDRALRMAGLEERAGQKVAAFSGGMKRRLNLSAGIVHDPAILFLDEPTVGIDAQSRGLILEKLLEIKATGVTMLYTTHYMEEAEALCDRVAIMDNGKILDCAAPKELTAKHPDCHHLGEVFLKMTGKALRD
jgi:ABC-2 type transport system ATP-binding protein